MIDHQVSHEETDMLNGSFLMHGDSSSAMRKVEIDTRNMSVYIESEILRWGWAGQAGGNPPPADGEECMNVDGYLYLTIALILQ